MKTCRLNNVCVPSVCADSVEDELHVILDCQTYADIRAPLVQAACDIDPLLRDNANELLYFILDNNDVCTLSAKTLLSILKRRRDLLYST